MTTQAAFLGNVQPGSQFLHSGSNPPRY